MKQTPFKSSLFGNFSKEASIKWLFITERKQLKGGGIYFDSWSRELLSALKWPFVSGFTYGETEHHIGACNRAK